MKSHHRPFVKLHDSQPFAAGGRRLCFVDPNDPDRCIKVYREDTRDVRQHRGDGVLLPARFRRTYDNNRNEYLELTKLMKRIPSADYAHLPRVHGFVETDRGTGLVQDLIRDADGQPSRNMRDLFKEGHDVAEFREGFAELSEYMLKHHILTRELPDHNLTAQHLGKDRWRLYIIDGMGDRAWISVAEWIVPLARAKVRRRLESCWRQLTKKHDHYMRMNTA